MTILGAILTIVGTAMTAFGLFGTRLLGRVFLPEIMTKIYSILPGAVFMLLGAMILIAGIMLLVVAIMEKNHNPMKKRGAFLKYWEFYMLLIPGAVLTFLFLYVPMYGVTIAFKNVRIGQGYNGTWVGFANFERLFRSGQFWGTLKNTLSLNIFVLILSVPLPIMLAVLLQTAPSKNMKKITQTATYLPYLVSMVVVVSLLNVFCNGEYGLFNVLRVNMGKAPINFFAEIKWFVPMYVISAIWQGAGYNAIVYLAALSSIDESVLEAARIDGASKWQMIWHIYLPMIKPTIVTMLLLNLGRILTISSVDKVLLMQTPLNLSVSETLGTYVYKQGIMNAQYGYAAAVGLFNNICNVTILLLGNWMSKKIAKTSMF